MKRLPTRSARFPPRGRSVASERPCGTARTQRGVALIAVLALVAVITALAVSLAHSNMLRLDLVERRQEAAQAWQIWRGGLEWARDILREDGRRSRHDHLGEFWARGLRDYPAEGATLTGVLEDQQARFNLNNLAPEGRASAADIDLLGRLLARLGLDAQLAVTLADWIDADRTPLPGGAEDAEYAQAEPPRRAANRPLRDLAELLQVRGFNAAVVERLGPWVTVLPGVTAINVNTASEKVLAALLPDLDGEAVKAVAAARPFAELTDFYAVLPPATQIAGTPPAVSSRYFLLRLRVRLGEVRAEGEALLDRGSGLAEVIARRRGLDRPLTVDNPVDEAELRTAWR